MNNLSDRQRITLITDAVHAALHDCDKIEDLSLKARCMIHLTQCVRSLDVIIDSAPKVEE